MNNTLSVVIPVYNAEKYIQTCIESILKQTYKKLDIILIDNNKAVKDSHRILF